jgi:hypothetical protein
MPKPLSPLLALVLLLACGEADTEPPGTSTGTETGTETETETEPATDTGTSEGWLSPEDFAETFAETACALYLECGYIESFGGSLEECITQLEGAYLAYVRAGDCAYDGDAARACIGEVEDGDCDAFTSTGPSETACDDLCG